MGNNRVLSARQSWILCFCVPFGPLTASLPLNLSSAQRRSDVGGFVGLLVAAAITVVGVPIVGLAGASALSAAVVVQGASATLRFARGVWNRMFPISLPGAAAITLGDAVTLTEVVRTLPEAPSIEDVLVGRPYQDWMPGPVLAPGELIDEGAMSQPTASVVSRTATAVRDLGTALIGLPVTTARSGVSGASGVVTAAAGKTAKGTRLPVYVGGFKGVRYHGNGRMFLPCMKMFDVGGHKVPCPAGSLAFQGEFREGRFHGRGTVFSCLRGGAIASVTFTEDGKLNRYCRMRARGRVCSLLPGIISDNRVLCMPAVVTRVQHRPDLAPEPSPCFESAIISLNEETHMDIRPSFRRNHRTTWCAVQHWSSCKVQGCTLIVRRTRFKMDRAYPAGGDKKCSKKKKKTSCAELTNKKPMSVHSQREGRHARR